MPKETKQTLEEERESLELELLREKVHSLRSQREQKAEARQRMDLMFKANDRAEQLRRENCKHRKGGKGKEGFLNGNDSNYSVIHHTYPTGELVIMCQRCQKEWRKPDAALRKIDPKAYREQIDEYQTALNWPTDNEPSGTQLFMISYDAATAPTSAPTA